ncbi:PTS sugar transporter subunit IIA [Natribacillus halophilus]|uniref:PTS system IIA component, Glc family n=1 Tax=Natribacillus halophilus TaxID=549003 RepID=A0A1G8JHB8_9BACI|nr:PTS glucose transporter subunit IIA [Natribacillus halophilus]SDI30648.1 PTS system IIA component, Glc family [Natribacillus halophilus]
MIKRMVSKIKARNDYVDVHAIANGSLIGLEDVEDPTIAHEKLGPGFAVDPEDGDIVSPVRGEVIHTFPTKHAVLLQSKEGLDVLVHVGLDSVRLQGEGLQIHVQTGDQVKVGKPLITADLDVLREHGISAVSAVIFIDRRQIGELKLLDEEQPLKAGETLVADVQMQSEEQTA